MGENHRQSDERPAIVGPTFENRNFTQIHVIALHYHFFDRARFAALDAQTRNRRQHLQTHFGHADQRIGRSRANQFGDAPGDIFRLVVQRQRQAFVRAEETDGDGHIGIFFHVAKEQSGARFFDDAVGDFGDFEVERNRRLWILWSWLIFSISRRNEGNIVGHLEGDRRQLSRRNEFRQRGRCRRFES